MLKSQLNNLKVFLKKFLIFNYIYSIYNFIKFFLITMTFSNKKLFTYYYRNNIWGSSSKSGPGSTLEQTKEVRRILPYILKMYHVNSVLDIPCGDFGWLSKINLQKIRYLGVDIVDDLVLNNTKIYGNDNINFRQGNILDSKFNLDGFDLIICRDLFIHFSDSDVFNSLKNICRSSSKYLLTTYFPKRNLNFNIKSGQFRPINLTIDPFNLPEPLLLINENCTEGDSEFQDKSLGLWFIEDIKLNFTV